MSSRTKGIVIALVTTIAIVAFDHVARRHDAVGWAFMLAFITVPFGAWIGSLAGRLREDRFLVLCAWSLALPGVVAVLALSVEHPALTNIVESMLATVSIPIALATAVLERWTRPTPEIPVAKKRGRRPSRVELAVALTVVATAVVALLATANPPRIDEYEYWYKHGYIDMTRPGLVFLVLVGPAVSLGVLLGRLENASIVVLIAIAFTGAATISAVAGMATPIQARVGYSLPFVLVALLLRSSEGFCRARPARSDP